MINNLIKFNFSIVNAIYMIIFITLTINNMNKNNFQK